VRDRRFDHLYDLRKRPVKEEVLERFAADLAQRLQDWPPAEVDWVTEELRQRWSAGLSRRPGEPVLRLALDLARLDLLREHEAFDERMRNDAPRACREAGDEAALQLLVIFLTEQCLALKDWADGARLTRADLARAVDLAARQVFRVTAT
jgi:hypothetical protein